MRLLQYVFVLVMVLSSSLAFGGSADVPEQYDTVFADNQIDISGCEKVFEANGALLCRPLSRSRENDFEDNDAKERDIEEIKQREDKQQVRPLLSEKKD